MRRLLERLPSNLRVRIQIEDQPIGSIYMIGGAAPGMQLEHSHLHQRDQSLEIINGHVIHQLASFLDRNRTDPLAGGIGDVSLVEALFALAFGTAHKRQRPACHMG